MTRNGSGAVDHRTAGTQPTATDLAVQAVGVGKIFPTKGGEVIALAGVDLEVAAGEFVSLIGPSGCGKSTLLRLIADLDQASSGTLEIFGKPARRARIDQDYGIAFQQSGLLPWRTVGGEHLAPARAARHLPPGAHRARRRARRARRPHRVRRPLPGPALRRHAAARRDRPRPRHATAAAAHGRALRRARRDDARVPADRAHPHHRRDRRRGRVRDPLDPRGGVPVRPRRRDEPAARAGSPTSSRPAWAASAARACASRPSTSSASPRCARRCTAPRSRGRTSDDRRRLGRTLPVGERALPSWLRFVAPVVVGVLMLALWILYVDVFAAAPRMLPSPAAIGAELVLRWDIIFEDMLVTATNALIGLVVGSLLAVLLAGLAAAARPIDGMLTPLVAALAVIPIVAITPILNTMFGASSQFGRRRSRRSPRSSRSSSTCCGACARPGPCTATCCAHRRRRARRPSAC